MAIDFSDKRVTMVVCPVDGRYGFYALSDPAAFAKSSVPMSAAQRSSPANSIKAGSNVC